MRHWTAHAGRIPAAPTVDAWGVPVYTNSCQTLYSGSSVPVTSTKTREDSLTRPSLSTTSSSRQISCPRSTTRRCPNSTCGQWRRYWMNNVIQCNVCVASVAFHTFQLLHTFRHATINCSISPVIKPQLSLGCKLSYRPCYGRSRITQVDGAVQFQSHKYGKKTSRELFVALS